MGRKKQSQSQSVANEDVQESMIPEGEPQGEPEFELTGKRIGVRIMAGTVPKGKRPVVAVTLGSKKFKTHDPIITDGQSDIVAEFNEFFTFDYPANTSGDVVIKCKDAAVRSYFTGASKLLGMVKLPVDSITRPPPEGAKYSPPQWYQLTDEKGHKLGEQYRIQVQVAVGVQSILPRHVRTLVGTWNVGNAPPQDDLSTWLRNEGKAAHIVAVGAQECGYKSSKKESTLNCHDDWTKHIEKNLGAEDYWLVDSSKLGEIRLSIFARADVAPGFTAVANATEATGIMHIGSNKGGVVTSFKLWDTSLCFVSSHLAAHQDKTDRRNDDYREIVGGAKPGVAKGMDITTQFHHLVWVGDLNYRVDYKDETEKSPTPENFKAFVDAVTGGATPEELAEIVEADQLVKAIKSKQAFIEFAEGKVGTHLPTFKVERDVAEYQWKDQRLPAWTDRILWRSVRPVEQLLLDGAPKVTTSDHKPVVSILNLGMRHLPALTGADVKKHKIKVVELTGEGLYAGDIHGTSDPYVLFFADFLDGTKRTGTENYTLDPIWPKKKLVDLKTIPCTLDFMSRHYLRVCVMDYDLFSQDDSIGRAMVPMKEVVEQFKSGTASFECSLMRRGKYAGTLRGKLQLVTP
eukprot:CAMPEP_0183796474 /NCGR_PEP_ID=MMETSP0803_2-20130417/11052_1 /TAXON_ID=195967 /ORGANISM="Crustomastix stigmata, Strain CCMP3273" /LENGTH=629 /DNA_ID=CAMNT_0026041115 /DNA_START=51 /DNA_END=1940 /DNA_ORIENTATION=+